MDFDQQTLLNLMSYPNDISDKEVEELREVLSSYPYFQLGHSLIAKAKHDKQAADAHEALTRAAVYAPNRSMLRSLFYDDLKIEYAGSTKHEAENSSLNPETGTIEEISQSDDSTESFTPKVPEAYNLPINEEEVSVDEDKVIESDQVYSELEENLRKLRESKSQYPDDDSEEEDKKKIVEHSKYENDDDENRDEPGVAPLLLEYVDSVNESQPLAFNQQQQNELIDKFINSDESGRLKARPVNEDDPENDLSLHSVNVSDDLVTENLAEIFRRQGKKEKAIEIYHKLIWKFPQKKAYFAEIIENIKAE